MSADDEHSLSPYDRPSSPSAERRWEYAEPDMPAYADPDEDEKVPWSRYVAALLRYKWLIALALLLGGVGAYVSWTFIQPTYAAQGSLWMRSDQGESEDQGPIAPQGLLESYAWIELLNSYAVLDSVVREEKLYLRPDRPEDLSLFQDFELDVQFGPGSYTLAVDESGNSGQLLRDGVVLGEAEAGETIGEAVGFRWILPESGLPAGREVGFSVVTPRDAAIQLREDLVTQMDQQGNFLRVELRGTDPRRITRVLNAVMERHVEVAADLKSGNLRERTQALENQLTNVEDELRTAERDLEEFRIQTITLPSEGSSTPIQPGLEMTRDPVFTNYFQMQVDLESLRRQKERLQDIVDRGTQGELPLEMLYLIPAVQESSELQGAIDDLRTARADRRALLQRYTPEHPPVQELNETIADLENEVVPTLLRELIRGLESEEGMLASRVDSAGSELSEIPPRAIEEARLRRRVAMAEQLYQDVRSRYETTSLAEASTIPDVRILDRATVPQVPANDERIRFAMIVFGGVLGLGLMGAIVLDRFDPRIRYPDDVERRFGLPSLGVIPTIATKDGKRSGRVAARQAYEAFRDLRTNVTFAYGAGDPLIIAISSPGQGDGKSLVAANLAMSFAHMGRRTLLIDGDTRRGYLHRTLGVPRKPGLTDFLASDEAMNGLAKETGHANLRLIPSGSRLDDSPELLSSNRLGEVMAELKGRHDVIVVDTPPLGAGPDAAILSCITGHLLLVLRSGSTNKEFTKTKLDPLRRLPVRILGIVLNDYSPKGLGAYTYYGNYLPGYEAGGEVESQKQDSEREEALQIAAPTGSVDYDE